MQFFIAVKAFIRFQDCILLLRESGGYVDGAHIGKYEIPGGRLHPKEPWKEGFLREIQEETGLNVTIGQPFHMSEWWPVVRGEPWHVVGTFIECFADSDRVVLSQDHDKYIWISPEDFDNFSTIANDKPVYEAYLDYRLSLCKK